MGVRGGVRRPLVPRSLRDLGSRRGDSGGAHLALAALFEKRSLAAAGVAAAKAAAPDHLSARQGAKTSSCSAASSTAERVNGIGALSPWAHMGNWSA
ncbi:hypothetical protein GCM10022402_20920 [Salinactinospora qingdaonensis]|uniref:Uncharacterized protein n=1 Tax=Salinactinospora qingdaonensis TaxID=702744 RepID=A0ABP7FM43_9ACTN